jgi:hypothetical protein
MDFLGLRGDINIIFINFRQLTFPSDIKYLQAHKRVKPINNIDNIQRIPLGTPSYMSKTAIVMVLLFMGSLIKVFCKYNLIYYNPLVNSLVIKSTTFVKSFVSLKTANCFAAQFRFQYLMHIVDMLSTS